MPGNVRQPFRGMAEEREKGRANKERKERRDVGPSFPDLFLVGGWVGRREDSVGGQYKAVLLCTPYGVQCVQGRAWKAGQGKAVLLFPSFLFSSLAKLPCTFPIITTHLCTLFASL